MAEGNGEIKMEEKQEMENVERTEDFNKLMQYGLDEKVAAKLDEIYKTGKLAHIDLDERALDALKEFPVDGALNVLTQFLESNLEHVSNKSAYLCGVMKTYRQKSRAGQGTGTSTTPKAPDEDKIKLDNHEIKPGKSLKVNISVPNLRLFVGNIPKSKGKEEILEEFGKLTAGLTEVIIYSSPDDKKKNRGFCFLEYESHKAASLAKRRLSTGRIKVWGCDIIVDWADPQEEPDEQTMSKVRVLYVRNLTQDCSEEKLKESFEQYGKIERVKKIKDYAFIHFEDRDNAVKAMNELNGKEMGGSHIEVSLAKPPSDKKKKEEMLRARERRMMQMLQGRGGGSPSHPSMMGGPMPVRGPAQGPRGTGAGMRGQMGRGDYG
ncbi:PREDICTED: heterogeneous nuclear ribonucleoprotein Q [Atta cephalotes]|uniref:RRM domain-containing protein n=1 Tax=Atta cephalotes TaxID=12957 RepID=A0A158NSK8_ATTCE|nr:PREDICTED: heterogeneous nuclear ribonucleoprotein Q [Atta cephalotes]